MGSRDSIVSYRVVWEAATLADSVVIVISMYFRHLALACALALIHGQTSVSCHMGRGSSWGSLSLSQSIQLALSTLAVSLSCSCP